MHRFVLEFACQASSGHATRDSRPTRDRQHPRHSPARPPPPTTTNKSTIVGGNRTPPLTPGVVNDVSSCFINEKAVVICKHQRWRKTDSFRSKIVLAELLAFCPRLLLYLRQHYPDLDYCFQIHSIQLLF